MYGANATSSLRFSPEHNVFGYVHTHSKPDSMKFFGADDYSHVLNRLCFSAEVSSPIDSKADYFYRFLSIEMFAFKKILPTPHSCFMDSART
jgi:hypothetical protein